MRTTVTLEDDVITLIQEEMGRSRLSFKQVLNRAVRQGLCPATGPRERFKVEAHSFGLKPGIDPDKLNQLADELEVEAFLEKYRRQQ